MMDDRYYMQLALEEARKAAELGEIPIGAVLVHDGEVVCSAHNMRETWQSATAHAEVIVIEEACKKLARWRLSGCTLYVTVEPCPMCAGAVANARIKKVYFGAYDSKMGAMNSVIDLSKYNFNHHFEAEGGILKEECASLLSDFFKKLRNKNERQSTNEQ